MGIGIRIKELMDRKGVSAYTVSSDTGISQSTLSRLLNKDSKPNASNLKALSEYFNVEQSWLITGEDYKNFKEEVRQIPFEDFMEAEYLPAQAQAGYLSSLEENSHLDLETILVPKEFEKGNYTVVEIVGSSMDDGTTRSICDGDKLLVKELEENLLNKLLPYRQYLFVIVSRDGIVCKQITNHNIETGVVTCHSFNSTWNDYEINLKDVFRIFFVKKIVERRINF